MAAAPDAGGQQPTFVLSEVCGSVAAWELDPGRMASAVRDLDHVVAAAASLRRGIIVKPRGEGDSHFVTFDDPHDALEFAWEIVRGAAECGGPAGPLSLKVALHQGPAEFRGGDWYGQTVIRCARLRGAARPGEVLLTETVTKAVGSHGLPSGTVLEDLGVVQLRDLVRPERVSRLSGVGLAKHKAAPFSAAPPPLGFARPRDALIGHRDLLDRLVAEVLDGKSLVLVGRAGVGASRLAVELATACRELSGNAVVTNPLLLPSQAPAFLLVDHPGDPSAVAEAWGAWRAVSALGPIAVLDAPITGAENVLVPDLDEPEAAMLAACRLADSRPGHIEPSAEAAGKLAEACGRRPLAIELAAAKTALLSIEGVLERLRADPLEALTPTKGRTAHLPSMRDSITRRASLGQLPPDELVDGWTNQR